MNSMPFSVALAEAKVLKPRIGLYGRRSGGGPLVSGHVYHILKNPIYIGRVRHREHSYPGVHKPIVDRGTWDAVQQRLDSNRTGERSRANAKEPSLLAGLIVDSEGYRFTPSHTNKVGQRYRHYVDRALITGDEPNGERLRRIPARAHLWCDRFKLGDSASIRQIAEDEQMGGSYVSRVLRLAFLTPDLVEAILEGRHPADLTAERLLLHENLPLHWREQRRQLGFNPQ